MHLLAPPIVPSTIIHHIADLQKTDSINYQRPSIHNRVLPTMPPSPPTQRSCPVSESPAKPKRDKSSTVVIDMGERRFDSLRLRSTSAAVAAASNATIPMLRLIAVALFASLSMSAGIRRTAALC